MHGTLASRRAVPANRCNRSATPPPLHRYHCLPRRRRSRSVLFGVALEVGHVGGEEGGGPGHEIVVHQLWVGWR